MRREIPTWAAIVIVILVIAIVGLIYWLTTPKPSPEVGGEPITKTAPPPGVQGKF
ncbi:MAG: hypothetical protein NZ805_04650 [Armatimonadetes bacterium]|nr:hypothetical protein [Armatimonadota bacterium]MDW8027229.1 hypothetical protein [Armatimonadota bacterium]